MARKYGAIMCTIWTDDDFVALSRRAQCMYVALCSNQKMTMVGVLPFTTRAWSRSCGEMTPEMVREDIEELSDANFVVVDEDTEELLIRTIVKHDPPKGPKSIPAAWRAFKAVESETLRSVIHSMMTPECMSHPEAVGPTAKDLQDAPSDAPPDPPADGGRGRAPASTVHLPPATEPPATVQPSSHSVVRDDQAGDDGPAAGTDDEEEISRRDRIMRAEVNRRARKQKPSIPPERRPNWDATTRGNLEAEHGAELDRCLREYPNAPDSAITARAIYGDTSNRLSEYQPTNNETSAA
jgi:hypothetical protein